MHGKRKNSCKVEHIIAQVGEKMLRAVPEIILRGWV